MASTTLRRLEGKVALITGAARGIGEAAARLFSRHGAKVIIADVQDDVARSICKDVGSTFVHCDVTKESDVEAAVNAAVKTHGTLDIMYNNAGVIEPPQFKLLSDFPLPEFNRIVGVNLAGVFLGTKHAARVMIPRRRGSIISTASVAGVMGGVSGHAYAASKHGVVGLMKNAAVELGRHGVRVNCVSPYAVASTPMSRKFLEGGDAGLKDFFHNLKGVELTAEDVAAAALYLASDESKSVSGLNLLVDGGFSVMNQGLNFFDSADS